MSLVSASGFITGVKEYIYRGIQEMPLVLILTSLLFVITTGSIAHTSLLIGLIVLMPIYGICLRSICGFFLSLLSKLRLHALITLRYAFTISLFSFSVSTTGCISFLLWLKIKYKCRQLHLFKSPHINTKRMRYNLKQDSYKFPNLRSIK